MAIKALACEFPRKRGVPLSRYSAQELAATAVESGIVAQISGVTVWRWLQQDAIKPWQHRSWIFPRDPNFEAKAGRVLDLYHREWMGQPLGDDDYVISADEKPSIQARIRIHQSLPPAAKLITRVEHEYRRGGALTYMAAWDVHHAKVFGRCEAASGIQPFGRLVQQVMQQEPYRSARRVFWVLDNGSSHRGQPCSKRLQDAWPNLTVVHLPIHASWLNQVEIYFSIVQRKVLTPNDFESLEAVAMGLKDFERRYEAAACPFAWKFGRENLAELMKKLSTHESPLLQAA